MRLICFFHLRVLEKEKGRLRSRFSWGYCGRADQFEDQDQSFLVGYSWILRFLRFYYHVCFPLDGTCLSLPNAQRCYRYHHRSARSYLPQKETIQTPYNFSRSYLYWPSSCWSFFYRWRQKQERLLSSCWNYSSPHCSMLCWSLVCC